jgi:16S rRNA processing protein RimM
MELRAIGKISRPVGMKGELRILPLTDDIQRYEDLKEVWVGRSDKDAKQYAVGMVRIGPKQVVIGFENVNRIDEAERMKDSFLFVPEEDVISLGNGRYFIDDVIGCEVSTEEGKRIGIVSDLLSLPGNDLWVIEYGKKEILVPAVKDIIKHVDTGKKKVVIHALEGLFD